MSYQDVLTAIEQLKGTGANPNFANKGNNLMNTNQQSKGVNPYSSGAYGFSSDSIYGNVSEATDPRTLYRRYGKGNLLTQGAQGLSAYKMGAGLDPFGKNIASTFGRQAPGSFGPAAALYGFTQNQNPYDFTNTEKLGTIGSTVLGARSLAPMLGLSTSASLGATGLGASGIPLAAAGTAGFSAAPIAGMHPALLIGSLLLGNMFAKKKKRRAQKANEEAIESVNEQRREGYESRSEKLLEARESRDTKYGEQLHMQESGRYGNQYGGQYNRLMAEEGMKFSPKELNKISKSGRNGDTMLAHINPQEAELLKNMGGSGSINPYTGLPEYWSLRSLFKPFQSAASSIGNVAHDVTDSLGVNDILNTGFNAAGQVADPVAGVAQKVVDTAGNLTSNVVNAGLDLGVNTLKAGGDVASTAMKTANKLIEPVLSPIMDTAMDISTPIMRGINDLAMPVMGLAHDIAKGGIGGFFDLLGGGSSSAAPGIIGRQDKINREKSGRKPEMQTGDSPQGSMLSNIKQTNEGSEELVFSDNNWMSDKDSPYIRENVEMYDKGGKANIVAEFTGNELIVNNQNAVEKGLSSSNYAMAAAPIRSAMKKGFVTPGVETHQGNPMPVDEAGSIYTKGGKLNFKVNKGAGVYDHATDQFRPDMTDKEIAMVAKKNINKWESNGMA